MDSDSLAVDLTVPVASGTTLKAEFHTGNNLDAYLGGVGQGTTAGEEIESTGWWLGLSHELGAKSMLNLGYGLDDPEDADLVAGDRSENSTLFANVTYALNSATSLGFEVGQHETGYIDGADEEALRLQVSATFKF